MITARMAVIVVLSSIAILLVVGTAVVRAASTMLLRRLESRDPISRANDLFLLRVMPGAMALFVSGVVILPTFLWLEPGNSQERIPTTMIAAAGCGCLLLAGRCVADDWRAVGYTATLADVAVTGAISREDRRTDSRLFDRRRVPDSCRHRSAPADPVHVRAGTPGMQS